MRSKQSPHTSKVVRSALEKLSDAELGALVRAIIREIGFRFVAEPEGDVAP